MIESEDASSVAATLAKNLMGVAKNKSSFEKLPDNFWGILRTLIVFFLSGPFLVCFYETIDVFFILRVCDKYSKLTF